MMQEFEERVHPEFGKLLSKPDISHNKIALRIMGLILSIFVIPLLISSPENFTDFRAVFISIGVFIIMACHLRSIFMNIEIYERGFIIRNYQTWKWRKERVRSYEVIDDTWDRLFIFPEYDVTLVGITDTGEKRKIIRRGKYPITQDVFDEIHSILTEPESEHGKSEIDREEDFDLIMRFSNWHMVMGLIIPLFMFLGMLFILYPLIATHDWISSIIILFIIISIPWSIGTLIYFEMPWDDVRTYMISDDRVRSIPNSSKKVFFDVEFNTITKVEMKTSVFSRSLIVHMKEGEDESTARFYVSLINNNIEEIEGFFREVKKRLPLELIENSQR